MSGVRWRKRRCNFPLNRRLYHDKIKITSIKLYAHKPHDLSHLDVQSHIRNSSSLAHIYLFTCRTGQSGEDGEIQGFDHFRMKTSS